VIWYIHVQILNWLSSSMTLGTTAALFLMLFFFFTVFSAGSAGNCGGYTFFLGKLSTFSET
jgi:hypothetical protein